MVGPEAGEEDVNRARDNAREDPLNFIAQETLDFSTHVLASDGPGAEEAYVDLRAFVLPAADYVMPGGLTRVANPRHPRRQLLGGRKGKRYLGPRRPVIAGLSVHDSPAISGCILKPMAKDRGDNGIDFGIRVGAVVERDGQVLLVRHQKPDREPYWVLPGGRLEPGETIPECAGRELAEETGLTARFSEILYVSEFMREGRHTVDVTVRATAAPDEEARLGSDPEVEEGSEPTLTELRWVEIPVLRDIALLPAWIKDRLVEDAGRGWRTNEIYLSGGGD